MGVGGPCGHERGDIRPARGDRLVGRRRRRRAPAGRPQGPNDFGLFDTLGNVWEWCWDFADPARYGDYRVFRGGGWADPAWSCRASVRRASAPDASLEDVGFRAARGPVGLAGSSAAQGWSADADLRRADIRGPLPVGWTPLRELLD